MKKMFSISIVLVLLTGCKSVSTTSAAIMWSESVRGLQIGITPPQTTFLFDRQKGWSSNAKLKVHLRNNSEGEIVWSGCPSVWSIHFSGKRFRQPEPFTDPMPPPVVDEPKRLAPGKEVSIQLPISWAFVIWPDVPEGEYFVRVSYSPAKLRTYAIGGEGNYERPFDVPEFWGDSVETPAVSIEVIRSREREDSP